MKRVPVASSLAKSIGHGVSVNNPKLPAIEIEMANTRIYQYEGVTVDQYNKIMTAESVGKALMVVMHAKVNGVPVYPCTEVDDEGQVVAKLVKGGA